MSGALAALCSIKSAALSQITYYAAFWQYAVYWRMVLQSINTKTHAVTFCIKAKWIFNKLIPGQAQNIYLNDYNMHV